MEQKEKKRQPKGRCKCLICVYVEKKEEREQNRGWSSGGGGREQGTEFVDLKSPGTGGLNRITW